MIIKDLVKSLEEKKIFLWTEGDCLHYRAPKGAVTSELKQLIRNYKKYIIEYLTQNNNDYDNIQNSKINNFGENFKNINPFEDSPEIKNYKIVREIDSVGISNYTAYIEPIDHEIDSNNLNDDIENKIKTIVNKYIHSINKELNDEMLAAWIKCANKTAYLDIFKTFYNRGIFTEAKEYSLNEIIEKMEIDKSFLNFMKKWLDVLVDRNIIEISNEKYKLSNVSIIEDISNNYWIEFEEIENYVEYGRDFWGYLKSCSENLVSILQQKVQTVDLLFPKGSLKTALGAYRNNRGSRIFNEIASEVVNNYVNMKSCNDTVKILEVGAGVGGTTSSIISALNIENYEYYFTDISNYFLNEAEALYHNNPNIKYQIFDINKPFYEQDIKAGTFDIIICANMLHNAKNGENALKTINYMMKDGGMFIIIDETKEPEFLLTSIELNDALNDFTDCRKDLNGVFFTHAQWLNMLKNNNAKLWIDFPRDKHTISMTGQNIFIGNFEKSYLLNTEDILFSYNRVKSNNQKLNRVIIVDDINCVNSKEEAEFSYNDKVKTPIKENTDIINGVKDIWRNILKLDSVELDDNFFEIGGDSLVITQLISQLWKSYSETKRWDWGTFADKIINNPTVEKLSNEIIKLNNSNSSDIYIDNNNEILNLTNYNKEKYKDIIVFFHDGTGSINIYRNLSNELNNRNIGNYEIYGLSYSFEQNYDESEFFKCLAVKYSQILKNKFQGSNVYLIGHCVGGNIALETAKLLTNTEVNVKKVILISSTLNTKLVLNGEENEYINDFCSSDFLLNIIFMELMQKSLSSTNNIKINSEGIMDALKEIKRLNNGYYSDNLIYNIKNKHEEFYKLYEVYKKNMDSSIKNEILSREFKIFTNHFKAASKYIPSTYEGEVCILKCMEKTNNFFIEEDNCFSDDLFIWSKYLTGEVNFHKIKGNHLECLNNIYCKNILDLLGVF